MSNWERMENLRKLFNVERTLFQSTSPELPESDPNDAVHGTCSPCPILPRASPETKLPRLPQMQNQTFYGIERQFEDLHDQFCCRLSPALQNKRVKNTESHPPPSSRRHVDVIEASFPAQHARLPTPISPASMYNEEIADRNIHSQRPNKPSTKYANVISAVYQEDVADRNILLGGGNTHTHAIGTSGAAPQCSLSNSRSVSSLSYYQESWPRLWSKMQIVGQRTPLEENRAELRVISSDQDLRSHPPSYAPEDAGGSPPRRIGVRQYIALRLKNSSPALSSQGPENSAPETAPQPQLKIYKVTPDRPPSARDAGKAPKFNLSSANSLKQEDVKPGNDVAKKAAPKLPPSDNASNRLLSPASANLSTRKNVRDLSINTTLAAPTKNFVKVPSQPLDIPVAPVRREPNASIAEIVNSPLPVATPSVVSPKTPSYNVEEIMSMFKHAYMTSQKSSPHPTFETLQDAIVREINSHEAFRQVASEIETMPFPEPSPAPTPIKHSEEIHGHMRKKSSSKSLSGREKQTLRLVGRSSFAKKRRNSYTSGKELSFPAIKSLEGGTEPDSCHQERRRRHTYSQPLPPGVPVAPQLPGELQEEARRANLASARDTPQPKYTYKLMPDVRPKSSHSVRSKGHHSRPGTSGSSKQLQSRRPTPVPQNAQSETAQRTNSQNTPTQQTKPETSKYELDHCKDGGRDPPPGSTNTSCATPEPKVITSNLPQQTTQKTPTKRLFSASPQPLGRNRIPLRRSSLQKDLFDSGRFKP
ncbi:hypothetical protein GX51_02017 [Blastomyces parvus]|uniref:Uncharacterized protein n=1 Tax=Blastomyces parvus TaxID=2060905 RepID=A0A2B7XE88_9EURO|nr:hypothetical protein GX51_02017 [Blastomyces parvus]